MNKYKEAIKRFNQIVDNEAYTDSFQDACKLAIETLEKSTPKKPKPSGYKPSKLDKWLFGSQKTYVCPTCGNQCLVRTAPNGRNENKYCYDCGQALDWSEENE